MASWNKELLPRENGELVQMQVPEIVSASRSTDIPAFYADWFFHRLEVGYSAWTNPYNGVKGYVSYKNTRFIVFLSKDPSPLLAHLDELKERGIGCYIQYTLNDYVKEGLEIVKAVYVLFLHHPEGIVFKCLPDFRRELADIYQKIKPLGLNERAIRSIEDVTNPYLNSINEKCARIRGAFISQFDENLAQHYYINGMRGEVKKIAYLASWSSGNKIK